MMITYYVTCVLIEKLERFTYFKDHYLNSHSRISIKNYREMLQEWPDGEALARILLESPPTEQQKIDLLTSVL